MGHRALAPVRAVLFDFGHTLFDTADSIELIVRESARLGRPIDLADATVLWNAARERSRTHEEMAKGRDLSAAAHRACWTALFEPLDERCPGLGELLYEFEISPAGWTPYPDVRSVLDALVARGVPLAVVSDTGWDLRPLFAYHGLASYFTTFVMSYQHGVTKPSPVLFQAACDALGVGAHEALMVGDNHRNDGGAIDSGLRTLLLPLVPSGTERGLSAVLGIVRP